MSATLNRVICVPDLLADMADRSGHAEDGRHR